MISELRVRELGVIADVDVRFAAGLTAITGETGAGKTLIVEALELLVGGRSDSSLVRFGADEALVEGRFEDGKGEVIISRSIPASGRTRAQMDDRMVPLSTLEERGRELLDLHGQHAHQSLLRAGAQRQALDEFARVDLSAVRSLRSDIAELDRQLEAIGGDERQRARELDLVGFELKEIEELGITSAEEESELELEETRLSQAAALRAATEAAYEALEGGREPGAADRLGAAVDATTRFVPLEDVTERLRALAGELDDIAAELRDLGERFEEDPERLSVVVERRQLLRRLVRKHGDSLADVLAAADRLRARVTELASSEARRAELEGTRARLLTKLEAAELAVGNERRRAARPFAAAVQGHLRSLALGNAAFEVRVSPAGIGDDVEFLLSANRGEPALPLVRVASGGELARVMLALRLVLTTAPPTLVFDEVDAGIGGEAALAVGRALASLGRTHQVLVVTHLAQVAAFADHQFVVEKDEVDGRTVSRCLEVDGESRVVELSRMLSGHPGSSVARRHAAELLEQAGADRG